MKEKAALVFLGLSCLVSLVQCERRHGKKNRYIPFRPANYSASPDSFWYGTQTLTCLFGYTRAKRSVAAGPHAPRSTLLPLHRVLYFKRFFFEWGVGENHKGNRVGKFPSTTTCPITWEPHPAGQSPCHPKHARHFTRRYKKKFGSYNLFANNCHHFANRLVRLLKSPSCQGPRAGKTLWHRMSYYFSFSSRHGRKKHKSRRKGKLNKKLIKNSKLNQKSNE